MPTPPEFLIIAVPAAIAAGTSVLSVVVWVFSGFGKSEKIIAIEAKAAASERLAAQKAAAQIERDTLQLQHKLQLIEASAKKEAARLAALAEMQARKIDSDIRRDSAAHANNIAVNELKIQAARHLAAARDFENRIKYEAALAAAASANAASKRK